MSTESIAPTSTTILTPSPDEASERSPRAKLLDLSLTQLIGGSMAAATAAALGSRLGVVGTIAGAAVGSVISAIAASIYVTSMSRAREALVVARRLAAKDPRDGDAGSRKGLAHRWRPLDRVGARRLLATSGAVFAVSAAFLLGLQLASGAPVTGTDLGTRSAQSGTVLEAPQSKADSDQVDVATKPTDTATTPATPATGTPTPGSTPGSTPDSTPTNTPTTPTDGGTTGSPTDVPTTPADPATSTPATPSTPTATADPTTPAIP